MARTVVTVLLGSTLAVFSQPAIDWPALTQKPHEKIPVKDLGLKPLDAASRQAWAGQRQQLHDAWSRRLGQPPQKPDKLDVKIEKSEKQDGYTRQLVSFQAADGDRIVAYLLVPDGIKEGQRRPAVVVFHQTTKDTLKEPVGLGKNPSLALGVHLVKRGYVVLCPECYILKGNWARAQAEVIARQWPGWTGMGKMTFDAARCVDFLQTLPFVDGQRIGCIGHSLGAKEVLYAMAFDARYKAGVFSEGGIGLRMSNWTDPWYLTDNMKKYIPDLEHHQVLALVAPRPILIVGGDSADGDQSWTFVKTALPVFQLLGAGDRIGMINHHAKHTFPRPARVLAYRWLDHWLAFTPLSQEAGD